MTGTGELTWLFGQPIAHRGLHSTNGEIPENSLAAFKRCVSARTPIELDVQQTSDGVVVVFHDYSLKRMTGKDIPLGDCTWRQLYNFHLGNSTQRIPSLQEVLDLVSGKVPILVEILNEGYVGALEGAVAALLERYRGQFAVQAFNPLVLAWFKKRHPRFLRGQVSSDFSDRPDISGFKKYLLKNMYLNFISGPSFISYDIRAGNVDFFLKLKKRFQEMPILLWTVDSKAGWAMCEQLEVNCIFERIDPNQLFGCRGEWGWDVVRPPRADTG